MKQLEIFIFTTLKLRIFLAVVLFLSILASLTEIVGIGLVIPFLTILLDPNIIFEHAQFQRYFGYFFSAPNEIITPVILTFISIGVISGSIRLLLFFLQTKFSYLMGAELSKLMFIRLLNQPYETHLLSNSGAYISLITEKSQAAISQFVMPSLLIFSSAITLTSIFIVLFVISPYATLLTVSLFSLTYVAIIMLVYRRVSKNSNNIASLFSLRIQSLQESFGGIRSIIMENNQGRHTNLFTEHDIQLRNAQASNHFISGSPRYIIETTILVAIALLSVFFLRDSANLQSVIPEIGAFAIGSQRSLPLFQSLYASFVSVRGSKKITSEILDILNEMNELPIQTAKIAFENSIHLDNVSFKYSGSQSYTLRNINLKFKKGQKIGIFGPSGSGKSTLIDIIMGLLVPTNGNLKVDGQVIEIENLKSWRKLISHVPQSIYVFDGGVTENITLERDKSAINIADLKKAISISQLDQKIINELDSPGRSVGEKGSRLSGGQLQRLGLARGIYRNYSILIMDESTSALDNSTEKKVISNLYHTHKNKTILSVSHHADALSQCDIIVEINHGEIRKISTFDEFTGKIDC